MKSSRFASPDLFIVTRTVFDGCKYAVSHVRNNSTVIPNPYRQPLNIKKKPLSNFGFSLFMLPQYLLILDISGSLENTQNMNQVAGSEINIAKKAVHADSMIGIYVAFCVSALAQSAELNAPKIAVTTG